MDDDSHEIVKLVAMTSILYGHVESGMKHLNEFEDKNKDGIFYNLYIYILYTLYTLQCVV